MSIKRVLALLALPVSLAFIVLAVWYWTTPAEMLPAYLPGYIAGSAAIHYKHGIASLLLGIACLAFSWFATGSKK
jgi:ammonia channel protein AmtB